MLTKDCCFRFCPSHVQVLLPPYDDNVSVPPKQAPPAYTCASAWKHPQPPAVDNAPHCLFSEHFIPKSNVAYRWTRVHLMSTCIHHHRDLPCLPGITDELKSSSYHSWLLSVFVCVWILVKRQIDAVESLIIYILNYLICAVSVLVPCSRDTFVSCTNATVANSLPTVMKCVSVWDAVVCLLSSLLTIRVELPSFTTFFLQRCTLLAYAWSVTWKFPQREVSACVLTWSKSSLLHIKRIALL